MQAQDSAQDTGFKTVRWVGDDSNRKTVEVRSRNGDGETDDELILGELDVNVAMM